MINFLSHSTAKPIIRYESTSPNGSAQCPQASDFIVLQNIILPFCGGLDWRVHLVVEALPRCLRKLIRLMQENKAGLWIAWMPGEYERYLAWVGTKGIKSRGVHFTKHGVYVRNDWWAVYHTDIHGNPVPGQLK